MTRSNHTTDAQREETAELRKLGTSLNWISKILQVSITQEGANYLRCAVSFLVAVSALCAEFQELETVIMKGVVLPCTRNV